MGSISHLIMATGEHIKRCELHPKWRELLHEAAVSFAKTFSPILFLLQVKLLFSMKCILVGFLLGSKFPKIQVFIKISGVGSAGRRLRRYGSSSSRRCERECCGTR